MRMSILIAPVLRYNLRALHTSALPDLLAVWIRSLNSVALEACRRIHSSLSCAQFARAVTIVLSGG
jgi:hypothetical protein